MSRATVRTAVKAWLDAPNVPLLNSVHRAKPRNWSAADFVFEAGTPASAAAYVHIERNSDERAALGKRFLDYDVALVYEYRSRFTGPTSGEDGMDVLDTFVENVKARLRLKVPGPLGGGSIFQCAERLLEDEADLPQDEAVQQSVWGVVRFDVSEWITA